MSHIKALIFDMDDTLVSTAALWRRAEVNFFKFLEIDFREDVAAKYKGMNSPDIGSYVYQYFKPKGLSEEECRTAMRSFLLQEFDENIEEMPGASDLLKKLSGKFKMALASGSPRQAIETALKSMGWMDHFHCIISSEEVARGKPEPDVFIKAAEELGVQPGEALVFEDSLPGTQAAQRAGMLCFAIPSNQVARTQSEAHQFFESLSEIRHDDITALNELTQ